MRSLQQLAKDAWVPCYEYALVKGSKLMLWFIWCILARIDTSRHYYAPLLRPWLWKCRRCGDTFPRNRGWSTSTHIESECSKGLKSLVEKWGGVQDTTEK